MKTQKLMETVYPRLPVAMQNVVCSAYGFREKQVRQSPYFWSKLRELTASEGDSDAEIAAYQDDAVARLVRHAYESVPYYRQVMDERGLKPDDIGTRDDLQKLPVLTKGLVRANMDALVSTRADKSALIKSKTSGTTGSALHFLTTRQAISFQWAVWWRHRGRFGIAPNAPSLNFTGKPVVPATQSRPPYWRWNRPMNQALVNMSQVVPHKIRALVEFANSQRFDFYSGYPSIVAAFCTAAREASLALTRRPDVVFLGAEPTLELQRKSIIETLGCRLTDQYGFSEGCGNASRCESDTYHEDWEFCALEPADPAVSIDGGTSAILATGFANDAFPMIRYEVGDVGTWKPAAFGCDCGRQSRCLESISGRDEDYVVTPEGARIMRFDYLFKETDGILEAQIRQEREGEITVVYVPTVAPDESNERRVVEGVRKYISPSMRVRFEPVNFIPRSASGKFRSVVSTLARRGDV